MLLRLRRTTRRLRRFCGLVGREYTEREPGMRWSDNRVHPDAAWMIACQMEPDARQQSVIDASVSRALAWARRGTRTEVAP